VNVILSTMFPKRFSICAMVATLVLLVVGCSSGGGKSSATTTPTTTPGTQVVHFRNNDFLGVLPCSAQAPNESLQALNAGVNGLAKKLVPIVAITVRICEYAFTPYRLQRSGTVNVTASAALLEDDANRLQSFAVRPECQQPAGAPFWFMTFATETKPVNITEDPCEFVTNSVRYAQATPSWVNELTQDTAPTPTSSPSTPQDVTIQTQIGSGPLPLVAGPYGFLVPQGWTLTPVKNFGGPGSFASWKNPTAPAEVLNYEINGGSLSIYNRDGSVNMDMVRVLSLAGCPVAKSQNLPNNELAYTCSNAPSGTETRGVVLVHPNYQGWLRVQVTLPPHLDETLSDILNSVH
jgi:hypothetical protein